MDTEKLDNPQVSRLLLGFCSLNKVDQVRFVDGLNRYMFVSPGKRRSLVERWKKTQPAIELHER
jgi:hypothetical protein